MSKIVDVQPMATTDAENYVLNLDAEQVITWTPQDVVQNFLQHLDYGYASEMFLVNKINGQTLMHLKEHHLQEMGVNMIGDRVYMLELIMLLKKKKKEMQTTTTLWSGETPTGECKYSNDVGHCFRRYVCPCCVKRAYWKVTGQGVFYRDVPVVRAFRQSISTDYMDYRFFKDLELKEEHLCCCFCQRYKLELYVSDEAKEEGKSGPSFEAHRVLLHPEAPKVEKIIRNAWNAARLVSE